jgi:hypothetical protein
MKRLFVFATVIALTLAVSGLLLAQSNPSIGTWKLNVAKSKYSPGPPPKSQTGIYEAVGNGVKVSVEGVAGDGSKIAYSYTANYDGKDYPVTGTGAPNGADTVAMKRVGANTIDATFKKAGKLVSTNRAVYSQDGKSRTITSKGTNVSGQPTNNVSVYEKQ